MIFMSNISRLKKSYTIYPILIFTFFMLITENGFTQASSGVGVRFGINKPYADAYKFGSGAAFQVNLRLIGSGVLNFL
jgi:hypothetical protein